MIPFRGAGCVTVLHVRQKVRGIVIRKIINSGAYISESCMRTSWLGGEGALDVEG